MTRKLRAAVVGLGFIGPAHVESIRRLPVGEVVGVLGSSPEQSRARAANLGVARAYSSLAELLADPMVDVVHLCTPNHRHCAEARAVLAAGKHVICEKPLALTSAESAELVRAQAASGRVGAVQYNIRFYPLIQQARALVAAGELGEIRAVHGTYLQDWLLHETDYNWRVDPAVGGASRTVADIGTHWLDLVQFITGLPVTSVCADLATFLPRRQRPATGSIETFTAGGDAAAAAPARESVPIATEDHASMLLRFANGARGALVVSQVAPGRKNMLTFEIQGSKAGLYWNGENPNELWIGHRDQANRLLIKDPSLLAPAAAARAHYPGGHAEGFPDSHKQLIRSVYEYILDGGPASGAAPPFPTFADAHREMLLIDAVLESTRTARWVDVDVRA